MGPWLLIAALQAEPARAPPIDRCSGDASFVEFRRHLSDAVRRKDVAALRRKVDARVKISFGAADEGWTDFAREWNLQQPAASGLWVELANVLSLGCDVYGDLRFAPGNFMKLSEFDGEAPYFAVRPGAALRTKPEDGAPLVMRLDHHVLLEIPEYDPQRLPEGWLHVRLTNGSKGYVRLADVRSSLDYRAGFEKRGGQWVMTSFVAGD